MLRCLPHQRPALAASYVHQVAAVYPGRARQVATRRSPYPVTKCDLVAQPRLLHRCHARRARSNAGGGEEDLDAPIEAGGSGQLDAEQWQDGEQDGEDWEAEGQYLDEDELLMEERRQTGAQAGPSDSTTPPGEEEEGEDEDDPDALTEEQWAALLDSMPVEPDPELYQEAPGKVPVVLLPDDPDIAAEAAAEGEAPWGSIYLPAADLPEEQVAALLEDAGMDPGTWAQEREGESAATEAGGKYPRPPERGVELRQLLVAVEEMELALEHQDCDALVFGVTDDPEDVIPGDIFCCLSRVNHEEGVWDGHDYVAEAVEMGAAAILAQEGAEVDLDEVPDHVPVVWVPSVQEMSQRLAAVLYALPSQSMRVVGVAGTSGKTTITWLVRGILEELGLVTGLVSSIEYALAEDLLTPQGELYEAEEEDPSTGRDSSAPYALTPYRGRYSVEETTPNGMRLQKLLGGMRDRGATAAVLELTSEALAMGATSYTDIDLAIWSNHGDDPEAILLHGSPEAYLEANLSLLEQLTEPQRQRVVVNLDDVAAPQVLQACRVPVVTYSMSNPRADVYAEDVKLTVWETELIVRTPSVRLQIISGLVGRHNAANILAAVAAGLAMGAAADVIVSGIEAVETVPGRAEVVNAAPLEEGEEKLLDDFAVVVDAANTPQRLATLLDAVREASAGSGRLFTVLGCDGEVGSSSSRAAMGEVAHNKSDYVIITNASPRGEVPSAIVEDIVAGWPEAVTEPYAAYVYNPFQDQGHVPLWFEPFLHSAQRRMQRYIMEDRFSAIRAAIGTAQPGDVVVLAGQGSRDYVEHWDGDTSTERGWFDDRVEARSALSKLSYLYSVTSLQRDTLPWGGPPDDSSVVVEVDV